MRLVQALLSITSLAVALSAPSAAAPLPAASATPTVASAPLEALTVKARELYAEGLKAFREQRWPQAYAAFVGALALQKHYAITGNLGAAEVQLGKFRDAAEHLAIYVRGTTQDPKKTPAERETAKLLFDSAAAKVVTVTVTVNVAGADVWMDGARIGAAPLEDPIFVEAGKHELEVRLDGYVTDRQKVEGVAGDKKPIAVTLVKPVGPVPTASATGTAGPVAPRSKVPAFVLGGVAVVGAAVGAGLFVAYDGKRDEVSKLYQSILSDKHSCVAGAANFDARCAQVQTAARSGDDLNRAGIGLLVGGGVLAAGAVGYWLWPESASSKGSVRVAPLATRTAGGFIVSGAW